MSWNNKVVWSEGLFLQPQHFQQQDRYFERLVEGRTAPLLGYSWGFCSIELNRNSAKLGKGKDLAYVEVNHGRVVDAKGATARYVRLYSNGNTSDELNHYCEVEVFGSAK